MGVLEHGQRQRTTATPAPIFCWSRSIGLAAGFGVAYFLAAQLSLGLLLQPDGVAVFWPATGISSGLLIALGPHARWPVAVGAMAGTIPANLMGDGNIAAAIAFALCNAAEPLIIAGLIQHLFGVRFNLDRLHRVLGLLAAAVVAAAASGVGGAVSFKLFQSPAAPMLTTWRHWFASDAIGILAVAPVVIGLAAAARKPPPLREVLEGMGALAVLIAMTGFVISLPDKPWETVVPVALLIPVMHWLSARFQPVFAAAGAFVVSSMVVWTTTLGIGHFGGAGLPTEGRILQAQAFIVLVSVGPLVLAALFSERRKAEAHLARSKMMLERERDNKLMNADAITAAIAHEISQPLTSIVIEGNAALQLLKSTPPDCHEVCESLNSIISGARRTSEIFDGVRTLFRQADEPLEPTDLNEIVLGVLRLVRVELREGGVVEHIELASNLPLVPGNRNQLQAVILNLVRNALEAMTAAPDRRRDLLVRTATRGRDAIVIAVEDSGPGIEQNDLQRIFDAFFTTKRHGMGLGLAICRKIIERHAGQLTAFSNGESGALFCIVLPAKPTDDAGIEVQ